MPPQQYPPQAYQQQYPPPGYQQGYPPPGYPAAGYQPYGYAGYAGPGYGPPPGHLGWAITAIILFWPLAIPAFINYSRVESCFYRGDLAGAQRASDQVRKFGIIALVVGIAFVVLWLVFAVVVISNVDCSGFDQTC
jgi:hypothetical protein